MLNRPLSLAKYIAYTFVLVALISMPLFMSDIKTAGAATTLTVNSTGDGSDSDPGDGVCEVSDGECTLRAAIQESNSLAGADTIEFGITGLPSFTNNGQDGYTIPLNDPLPLITSEIIINGYSQLGAQANSAIAPQPFNGTLLIEIDGTALANTFPTQEACVLFGSGADNSEMRGLVVNKCGGDGVQLFTANFVDIKGNYIGTDPEGLLDEGNGRDNDTICTGSGIQSISSNNLVVGGTLPQDRNIIAGNQCDDIFVQNEADNANESRDNIVQGNYIGLGADGLTALPAGYEAGLGNAILFGNSHDDLIGGTDPGAINVVSTSYEFGLSFRDGCSGTVIQGNYVGTDYTGNASLSHGLGTGNINTGVHIFALAGMDPSHDFLVGGTTPEARNVIAGNFNSAGGWVAGGVAIEDGAYNNRVIGNYIGVGADGLTELGNQGPGVELYVNGTNNNIIGGTTSEEANVIAHNGGAGVWIGRQSSETVSNAAVLGNSIFNNDGLGIDLGDLGVTENDDTDPDSGPNDLLNFPIIISTDESGGNTTIEYELDVPAGEYRIEFFRNTILDTSGNGEGEIFLGFDEIVHSGLGVETFTHLLTGVGIINIAMTATEIDDSTPSGFGATSEFGGNAPPVVDTNVTKALLNPDDIAIGADVQYMFTLSNDGDVEVDLSLFTGNNPGADSIFLDVLPPDLDFVSINNPNITCTAFGDGSASGLGSALGNHADYELVNCGWTGPQTFLQPGDSLEVIFTTEVVNDSDLIFTNYVISATFPGDPDIATMAGTYSSGGDVLDALRETSAGNFSLAEFLGPVSTTTPGSNVGNNNAAGSLSVTGINMTAAIFLAAMLISLGLLIRRKRRINLS